MADVLQNMRWVLMVLCLVVFASVFVVMLASMWLRHRRADAQQTNFHGSVAVEICWAVAPFAIVVMMVWPTARAILGS